MTTLDKFHCNFAFKEIYTANDGVRNYKIPVEDNDQQHLIEVTSIHSGLSYTLVVDSGYSSNLYNYPHIDLIATCSDPNRIFAIFGNAGFNINCENPADFFALSDDPIKFVHQNIYYNNFIVCFNSEIVAYTGKDIAWTIELDEEMYMDQYYVDSIDDFHIIIKYYSFSLGKDVFAKFSLENGFSES